MKFYAIEMFNKLCIKHYTLKTFECFSIARTPLISILRVKENGKLKHQKIP